MATRNRGGAAQMEELPGTRTPVKLMNPEASRRILRTRGVANWILA